MPLCNRLSRVQDRLQVADLGETYVVALEDGQLPVEVYDQGCNPWHRGKQLIDVDAVIARGDGPRWGQGWTVLDTAGTERWFASNWDSSG